MKLSFRSITPTNKKLVLLAVLFLLSVVAGLFLVGYRSVNPQNVMVTNITDRSATISWSTTTPSVGMVIVKEGDILLPVRITSMGSDLHYDDRDYNDAEKALAEESAANAANNENGAVKVEDLKTDVKVKNNEKYYVHHVTVKGLKPETEYSFMVGNGNIFVKGSAANDIGDSFKTYAELGDITVPDPAYGLIKRIDFEKSAVKDGVIYLQIVDDSDGVKSSYLSSVLNETGAWYIDLANARSEDGKSQFVKTISQDSETVQENIKINAGPDGIQTTRISIHADAPASTVYINKELDEGKLFSLVNSLAFQSHAATWTVTCSDGRTFTESNPSVQAGFDAIYNGDGETGWGNEACAQTSCAPPGCGDSGNGSGGVGGGGGSQEPPTSGGGACDFNGDVYSSNVSCCGQGNADNPKSVGEECAGAGAFCANGGGCDGFGPLACSQCPDGAFRCTLGNEGCDGTTGTGSSAPICCAMEVNGDLDYIDSTLAAGCSNGYSKISDSACPSGGGNNGPTYDKTLNGGEQCFSGETCLCTPTGAVLAPLGAPVTCTDPNPANAELSRCCLYVSGGNATTEFNADGSACAGNPTQTFYDVTSAECSGYETNSTPPVTPGVIYCDNMGSCDLNEVCNRQSGCSCGAGSISKNSTCSLQIYQGANNGGGNQGGQTEPGTAQTNPQNPPQSTDGTSVAAYCGSNYGQQGTPGWCFCCANGSGTGNSCLEQGFASYCTPDGTVNDSIEGAFCYGTGNGAVQNLNGQDYICQGNIWSCFQDNLTSNVACRCGSCTCGANTEKGSQGDSASNGESCGVSSTFYTELNPLTNNCVGANEGDTCMADPNIPSTTTTCKYYCMKSPSNPNTCAILGEIETYDGPQLACKSPGQLWMDIDSQGLVGQSVEGSQYSQVAGASDTETSLTIEFDSASGTAFVEEGGRYVTEIDGQQYFFDITQNGVNAVLYFDKNDNGTYDDGDEIVTPDTTTLTVSQEYVIYSADLQQGFNLISFDVVDYEEGNTASKLLEKLNTEYQDAFYSIARFDSGRWEVVGNRNGEEYSGTDFQIVPGKGYLLRAKHAVQISIEGRRVLDPVPIHLTPGWNLVGVHGSETAYTAESLLESIDALEGTLFADNVSRWESNKGRYEGLQREKDEQGIFQVYGFDFPLVVNQAYFVRVNEGEGQWLPQ